MALLGCFKSCLGQAVTAALLVVAAYAGWRWGPAVFPRVEEWLGVGTEEVAEGPRPTPELADSVLARVQTFLQSGGDEQMVLSGLELTSVIRYAVPGLVPEGIEDPEVTLSDGRIHLRARVILDAFPELPDLGPILGILPDTLNVELEASLMPYGEMESALLVQKVEASRIPIPRRLIPEILSAMGRVDKPGLPPEAITVPMPSGLASAYVLTDSLVLSTNDP
jgi:hypothetical protein